MNPNQFFKILALVCLTFSHCLAQDENTEPSAPSGKIKRVNIGFYVGTYFANKYTANLYDGYGYDWNGNKNNFANSWMNQKINYEYGANGAYSGQQDRIALALGVQHGQWNFNDSLMPLPNSLKYNIAFLVGLQTRYCFDKKSSLLVNVNGAKLTVNGAFQIQLTPVSAQPGVPGAVNYRTFSIIGGEQRMLIQMGYQRIMGDDEKLNFFWEAGPIVTLVKFEKNVAQINTLTIPLTTFYNPYGYILYNARNLTGVGLGAFAGLGMNISISPKWTVQLVYNPSYEKVKLGPYASLKLQHAIGLRAYYNF